MARLRAAAIAAIGMDAASQRDVVRRQRIRQQRQLVRRRGQVGVGEDHVVGVRGEHARLDGAALAGVWLSQEPEVGLGTSLDDGRGVIVAAVVDQRTSTMPDHRSRAARLHDRDVALR